MSYICPQCRSFNVGPSGYCYEHDPAEIVYRDLVSVELDRLAVSTGTRRFELRQEVHGQWGGRIKALSSSRDKYGEESYP